MANDRPGGPGSRMVQEIASVSTRAAARTLRPLSGAVTAAASAGIDLERRTLDRVLESEELERVLMTTLQSPHLQAALGRALSSDGASRLVDTLFDSGLFDRIVDRLLASDALWRLVDEIVASPAVTVAISQQGLGFADQVGNELRVRTRAADGWVERVAQRVVHRGTETS